MHKRVKCIPNEAGLKYLRKIERYRERQRNRNRERERYTGRLGTLTKKTYKQRETEGDRERKTDIERERQRE